MVQESRKARGSSLKNLLKIVREKAAGSRKEKHKAGGGRGPRAPVQASAASKMDFEIRIASLLRGGAGLSETAQKTAGAPDGEEAARFLYAAGMLKSLLKLAMQKLQSGEPVPWPFLLAAFRQRGIEPAKADFDILLRHFLKDAAQKSPAMLACKGWESVSPEFERLRSFLLEDLREKNISEAGRLLNQLEFVQSQNLVDEEEKILRRLLRAEPDNPKFKKLQKAFQEKKAAGLIQKKRQALRRAPQPKQGRFVPEQKPFKERWFQAVSSLAEQNPKRAKPLALFLYFAGWPEKSLKILEERAAGGGAGGEECSDSWFCIDWLLETKQYAAGLSMINKMIVKKQHDPDALFFLSRAKALALYYLGKKSKGIESLKAVINARPGCREAQFLLDQWTRERS